MADVTMNIESAIWAAPGSVTFANESVLDLRQGGDIVEHSSGVDKAISSSKVVSIRGLYTIGFDDRVTFAALFSKIDTEASMVMKTRDIDAATGLQVTGTLSRLQDVFQNTAHNAPTRYSAVFYSRSSDGAALPMSAVAF